MRAMTYEPDSCFLQWTSYLVSLWLCSPHFSLQKYMEMSLKAETVGVRLKEHVWSCEHLHIDSEHCVWKCYLLSVISVLSSGVVPTGRDGSDEAGECPTSSTSNSTESEPNSTTHSYLDTLLLLVSLLVMMISTL